MASMATPSASSAASAATAAAAAAASAASQSQATHLANSALNLTSLREYARKELCRILDSVKGKKILFVDANLSGPLFLITDRKLLKEHGVEKVLPLTPDALNIDIKSCVFLVRPRTELMKTIARHIHANADAKMQKEYSIYFVPRRTMLCERVLAEKGVYGDVTTGEYHLDLIPFDEDVLSLELPLSFRECFLDGDPTSLFYVARSLMKLQSMFGLIPTVIGKGDNASQVFNLMRRMRVEMAKDHFDNLVPEVHQLILIDRSVDMITPLLTQMTYEGLIDEVLRIKNGYVEVETELLGKAGQPPPGTPSNVPVPDKKQIPLNSSDSLFGEIRDMPFRALGGFLHKKAEEIKGTYNEKESAQTVSQMKDFVKKFKTAFLEHNSLTIHLAIAGKLSEVAKTTRFEKRIDMERAIVNLKDDVEQYIETCIATSEPLLKVLRLLCLLSLTHGIKPKKFDFFRREIIHTYGFEVLFTLNNLEKMGLFRKQAAKSPWAFIKKSLRLHKDDADPRTFDEKAYVFGGVYAPLSVRLVEIAADRNGWRGMEEIINALPGRAFEERQELPPSVIERGKIAQKDDQAKKPVTLVYFLGGVTYSEISAIRHLCERDSPAREFLVASTQLTNGDLLLTDLIEHIENNLKRATIRGDAPQK